MMTGDVEKLHAQYERVTQVQGIVSCARYASDSMLVPYRGQPDLVDGLQAAYNMLSDVAEVLQDLLPDGYGNVFDEE
jgi:hypothetical protein